MEWDKILTAIAGVIIAAGTTYAAVIGARVRKDQKASQTSIESGQSEGTEKIILELRDLAAEVRANRAETQLNIASNTERVESAEEQHEALGRKVEILEVALHGLIKDALAIHKVKKRVP